MDKVRQNITKGLLVTGLSLVGFMVSFLLYYMLFILFERVANMSGTYNFVGLLRIFYGLSWFISGYLLYRSNTHDILKASLLACALATFLVTMGINFYQTPMLSLLFIIIVVLLCIAWLYKQRKSWYHYYAVLLAVFAIIFYM